MKKSVLAIGAMSAAFSLFAADPVLDEDLRAGLALWMDASVNVTLDGQGGVSEWRDVREASGIDATACQYVRAVHVPDYYTYFDSLAPTMLENVPGYAGRKFVDFGLFDYLDNGPKRWLLWQDASSATKELRLRSCFAFIKLHSATASVPVGPLIASTKYLLTSYSYNGSQARWLYTKGNAEGLLTNTETRVNGALVPSTYVWPATDDCCLLSQVGPNIADSEQTVRYDNFGNAAGYHQISEGKTPQPGTSETAGQYKNGNRQGGAIIGEILCYDRCVTDAERRRIEAYLLAKWRGADIRSDLPAAGGDIVKSTGTLQVERNSGYYPGTVTLGTGAVLTADQNQALPKLALAGGTSATVATGSVAMAAGTAGVFAASGSGELTIGSVDAALKRIASAGVGLRLASTGVWQDAVASDPFYGQASPLKNGDFEDDTVSGAWVEKTPADWTGAHQASACSVVNERDTTIHKAAITGPVPSGKQFVSLGAKDTYTPKNGELQQTFTVAAAGIYGIRLWHSARHHINGVGYAPYPCRMQLEVDGTNCVDFTVGYDMRNTDEIDWTAGAMDDTTKKSLAYPIFLEYEFPTPPLAAGEHTLLVRQVSLGSANASVGFYDNIRIVPRRSGEYAWLPDSSFDSWGAMSGPANSDRENYGFNAAIGASTLSAWKVSSGTITSSQSGINQDSRFWWVGKNGARTNEVTRLRYHRNAYMLNDTTISNTVTFAKAGTYTFSVDYARTDWGANVAVHSCEIWLEDPTTGEKVVDLGKVEPRLKSMTTYDKTFELEAPGAYTIAFRNVDLPSGTGGGTSGYGTIVDEVRFRYGGAVTPSPYDYRWDFTAQTMDREGEMSLPVRIDEAGPYRLNLSLRGKALDMSKRDGVYHGYSFYPQAIDVLFDGTNVGRVIVDEPEAVTFAVRVPWATVGAHTVELVSDAAASAAKCESTLTSIGFDLLTEETVPEVDLTDVRLSLANGAKLALDFAGEKMVRGLKIDGVTQSGTVSAATCDAITGRGTLKVCPVGAVIIFR